MAKITKAAYYEEFGSLEKIKVGSLPVPELKEGEVLVQVKAAGINPVDAAVREGYLNFFIPVIFPAIPGWDVAGVVVDRGYSARRFKPGDEVYAYARRPLVQNGTFAEYLSVEPNSAQLTILQELADAGQLKVPVSKTFSLDETQEAFRQIESYHTTGKVIITP